MPDRLSRERIAELREWAEACRAVCIPGGARETEWRDIIVALDAYEAQRPRPASEAPEHRAHVLVRLRRQPERYHAAWYDPRCSEPKRWMLWPHDYLYTLDILDWLPFPPAPERDDG